MKYSIVFNRITKRHTQLIINKLKRHRKKIYWQTSLKWQLTVVAVENAAISSAKYIQKRIKIQASTRVKQNKCKKEDKQVEHLGKSSTGYQWKMYMKPIKEVLTLLWQFHRCYEYIRSEWLPYSFWMTGRKKHVSWIRKVLPMRLTYSGNSGCPLPFSWIERRGIHW